MAVKIRMSRVGRTNRPYWRIVAVDSRCKRDGAYLDCLGTYDPIRHEIIQLHTDRIEEWVKKGAKCSDSVTKLIKRHAKGPVAAKSPVKKVTKKAEAPKKEQPSAKTTNAPPSVPAK